MRARVISALFLSVVLILGAVVIRVRGSKEVAGTIVSVDKETASQADSYTNTDVANLESPDTQTSNEALNTTDLIGRQMMADYMDLAAAGQATDDSIMLLAEKYINNIPALSQSKKISELDVKAVPDSFENLKNYSDTLTNINQSYIKSLSGLESANLTKTQDMFDASKQISSAYDIAAASLLKAKVPSSLVEAHIKLVNAYLGVAESMHSITLVDSDPATAFAGATGVLDMINEAEQVLSDIRNALHDKGV